MLFRLVLFIVCFGQAILFAECERLSLGDRAPTFTAESTKGILRFPDDFDGKWVVFYSLPGVYTPICTEEVRRFGEMKGDFDRVNCELVGISLNTNYSHKLWLDDIANAQKAKGKKGNYNFPIFSDVRGNVAEKYHLVHPKINEKKMIRAVYIIDPKGNIRAIVFYPIATGRSINEIKRELLALQATDKHNGVVLPDWQAGDEVTTCPSCLQAKLLPPPEDFIQK